MSMCVYFKGEQLQAPCCNRYEGDEKGWPNEAGRMEVGQQLNEALNVIVMEKLFNLPLMAARGTCVKLIAYKKFIPSFRRRKCV